LQAQFHSIAPRRFERMLRENGFSEVEILPGGATAPLSELSWKGKLAYLGGGAAFRLSLGRVNVSPGILVFARKRF
jgi:hypothetical protein